MNRTVPFLFLLLFLACTAPQPEQGRDSLYEETYAQTVGCLVLSCWEELSDYGVRHAALKTSIHEYQDCQLPGTCTADELASHVAKLESIGELNIPLRECESTCVEPYHATTIFQHDEMCRPDGSPHDRADAQMCAFLRGLRAFEDIVKADHR